ncbi:hypothetical protein BB558_007096 [Smittium angustum]|uniref:Uncharacterized protein n=1 Tax=Smittium angustum TaxID=133377 RepID=A0A2U1IW72_SMIAN|nr:hypothetical protein BB558_007096 [Smittium angustum]
MEENLLLFASQKRWSEISNLFLSLTPEQLSSFLSQKLSQSIPDSEKVNLFRISTRGCLNIQDLDPNPFLDTVLTIGIQELINEVDNSTSTSNLSSSYYKGIADILSSEISQLSLKSSTQNSLQILKVIQKLGKLSQNLSTLISPLLENIQNSHHIQTPPSTNKDIENNNQPDNLEPDINTQNQTKNTTNFVNKWIEDTCKSTWLPASAVRIAATLVDISLPKNLRILVINKLISQMDLMQLDELPPLIYQLFLHSKHTGKRIVISGVINFFQKTENFYLEKLNNHHLSINETNRFKLIMEVEGTVLLHILFCVQQDPEWANEILKFAKQGERKYIGGINTAVDNITPFLLAIILSLATISKFRTPAREFIKTIIMTSSKDLINQKTTFNGWGRELIVPTKAMIFSVIKQISLRDSYGWENVILQLTHGLILVIDYGFSLSATKFYNKNEIKAAIEFSKNIIGIIFKKHEFIQSDILKEAFSRLEDQNPSAYPIMAKICDTLKEISTVSPNVERIFSNSLEWIVSSHLDVREKLMSSIGVFISNNNSSFGNSIILILRKGLYSKNTEMRKLSISGIVELITIIICSNCNSESDTNYIYLKPRQTLENNENIGESSKVNNKQKNVTLLELVGFVRRSFTLQLEVVNYAFSKIKILTALQAFLENPDFAGSLFRILHSEFEKFYEIPGSPSPLNFAACLSPDNKIIYPLPSLISTFFPTVFSLANSENFKENTSEGIKVFVDIFIRMLDVDFEELGINPELGFVNKNTLDITNSSNFETIFSNEETSNMASKEKNASLIILVINTYDVLLDLGLRMLYKESFNQESKDNDILNISGKISLQICIKLYEKRNEIIKIVLESISKENGSNTGRNTLNKRNINGNPVSSGTFSSLNLNLLAGIGNINTDVNNNTLMTNFLSHLVNQEPSCQTFFSSVNPTYDQSLNYFLWYLESALFNILEPGNLNALEDGGKNYKACLEIKKNIKFVEYLLNNCHQCIKNMDPVSGHFSKTYNIFSLIKSLAKILVYVLSFLPRYFTMISEEHSDLNEFQELSIRNASKFLFGKVKKEKTVLFLILDMISTATEKFNIDNELALKVYAQSSSKKLLDILLSMSKENSLSAMDCFCVCVSYFSEEIQTRKPEQNLLIKDYLKMNKDMSTDTGDRNNNNNKKAFWREQFIMLSYSRTLLLLSNAFDLINPSYCERTKEINNLVIKCLNPTISICEPIWKGFLKNGYEYFQQIGLFSEGSVIKDVISDVILFGDKVNGIVLIRTNEDNDSVTQQRSLEDTILGYFDTSIVSSLLRLFSSTYFIQEKCYEYFENSLFWGLYKGPIGEVYKQNKDRLGTGKVQLLWESQDQCLGSFNIISKGFHSLVYEPEDSESCDEDENNGLVTLSITNFKTGNQVIGFLLGFVEKQIADCEYMIQQLLRVVDLDVKHFGDVIIHAVHIEQRISHRIICLIGTITPLIESQLPPDHIEGIYKMLISIYKCLTALTNAKINCVNINIEESLSENKEGDINETIGLPITNSFINLLTYVGSSLNPIVFKMLNSTLKFEQREVEAEAETRDFLDAGSSKEPTSQNLGKKSQGKDGKSNKKFGNLSLNLKNSKKILSKANTRLKKEAKLVPQLIYFEEKCEHSIMSLGVKSKVSLIHLFKRSVIRDFKLDIPTVASLSQVRNNVHTSQRNASNNSYSRGGITNNMNTHNVGGTVNGDEYDELENDVSVDLVNDSDSIEENLESDEEVVGSTRITVNKHSQVSRGGKTSYKSIKLSQQLYKKSKSQKPGRGISSEEGSDCESDVGGVVVDIDSGSEDDVSFEEHGGSYQTNASSGHNERKNRGIIMSDDDSE